MLAWLFPLGPCLQFYLPGVPLILVLSLPQHSPDTWLPSGKARPNPFLGSGRGSVGLSSSLWLCLALGAGGVGSSSLGPLPSSLFSDTSDSDFLCSDSESWSSVWGTSTAWDGRSGVGPLEISTWVSVPDSSSVVLEPPGWPWGRGGRKGPGFQALKPEYGSRAPVACFGHFVCSAFPGGEGNSTLGLRQAEGLRTVKVGRGSHLLQAEQGRVFLALVFSCG